MQQIKQNIWQLLSYNWVGLLLRLLFLTYVYVSLRMNNLLDFTGDQSQFFSSFLYSALTVYLLAAFFASGLTKFKQSYLFRTNKYYQKQLFITVLLLSAVISLSLMLLLSSYKPESLVLVMATFSTALYIIWGTVNSTKYKIFVIVGIPVLVIFKFNFLTIGIISINSILKAIGLYSLLLLSLIYYYVIKPSRKKGIWINNHTLLDKTKSQSLETQLNYLIYQVFKTSHMHPQGDIGFAITSPISKLGLSSVIYLFVVVYLGMTVVVYKSWNLMAVENTALILLSIVLAVIILKSRYLLKQTRRIAHVFEGKQHQQLKQKILRNIDKTVAVNALFFLLTVLLFSQLFNDAIHVKYLLLSSAVIVLFILASYPLVFAIKRIPFIFVIGSSLMALVSIEGYVIHWLASNIDTAMTANFILPYLAMCVGLRIFSQGAFIKTSYERLLDFN
jgi:hypothetical protein